MSWTGTVHCGHCYKTGHNRRGCPEIKAALKQEKESGVEGPYTRNANRAKANAKVRSCTFCEDTSHNRRTCAVLKEELQFFVDAVLKQRRSVLKSLAAGNIVVGSFVRYRFYDDYYAPSPHVCATGGEFQVGVVTGIHWHRVTETILHAGVISANSRNCMGWLRVNTHSKAINHRAYGGRSLHPADMTREAAEEVSVKAGRTPPERGGRNLMMGLERVGDTTYVLDEPPVDWLDVDAITQDVKTFLKGTTALYGRPSDSCLGTLVEKTT